MADVEAVPVISFKKRAPKASAKKRAATPPPVSDSDSGFESSEDEQGRQMKRRKKHSGITATSTAAQSRTTEETKAVAVTAQSNADNATKRSNWFDEEDSKPVKKSGKPDATTTAPDGIYKGTANYQSFITKNLDRQTNVGPQKLNSNVRSITVTDFAPDVCKDYKQTGFCGFGDSCKFLHAREDYKQGWQLDKDWEVNKKPAAKIVASANRTTEQIADEDDEKLLESIPFKCVICKGDYKNPIVTKCGHYFCEVCALKRYRKDPSCAQCGSGTGGVFNVAKKLNRLLERKREREREKEEASEVKD